MKENDEEKLNEVEYLDENVEMVELNEDEEHDVEGGASIGGSSSYTFYGSNTAPITFTVYESIKNFVGSAYKGSNAKMYKIERFDKSFKVTLTREGNMALRSKGTQRYQFVLNYLGRDEKLHAIYVNLIFNWKDVKF